MKNKKKGFSLIELSVVVLIIGLLIAAVIGGRKLVTLSNLSKARALTNSSPVAGIEDLALWLETTSKNSFLTTQPSVGSSISQWNDINPQQVVKNHATQSTGANQPVYNDILINGLPGLTFDSAGPNYLAFSSVFLTSSDYTIFAVEQKLSSRSENFFFGNDVTNMGYQTDINFTFGDLLQVESLRTPVPGYSTPRPVIITGTQNSTTGKRIWFNGTPGNTQSFVITPNNAIMYVGRMSSFNSYTGNLGEIIVFNRELSDFERGQIEQYLSKKWGIKLT